MAYVTQSYQIKKNNFPGCLPQIKGKHVSATCCVMPSMFVWQGISLPAKQYLISCDKVQSWHIGPPLACVMTPRSIYCSDVLFDVHVFTLYFCDSVVEALNQIAIWFSTQDVTSTKKPTSLKTSQKLWQTQQCRVLVKLILRLPCIECAVWSGRHVLDFLLKPWMPLAHQLSAHVNDETSQILCVKFGLSVFSGGIEDSRDAI